MKLWTVAISIMWMIVAVGCAEKPESHVDPEFQELVSQFQREAQEHGVAVEMAGLTVAFGDFEAKSSGVTLGSCRGAGSENPRVKINSASWPKLSQSARKEVIFHELGHCILVRAHKDDVASTGFAKSLMARSILSERLFVQNEDGYLRELFTQADFTPTFDLEEANSTTAKIDVVVESDCDFSHQ